MLCSSRRQGISLVEALREQGGAIWEETVRELLSFNGPFADEIKVDQKAVSRLPVGLCRRLFAAPILPSQKSGAALAALVDPWDSHAAEELMFHLGARITVVRVRAEVLLGALAVRSLSAPPAAVPARASVRAERVGRTPPFGTPAVQNCDATPREPPPDSRRGVVVTTGRPATGSELSRPNWSRVPPVDADSMQQGLLLQHTLRPPEPNLTAPGDAWSSSVPPTSTPVRSAPPGSRTRRALDTRLPSLEGAIDRVAAVETLDALMDALMREVRAVAKTAACYSVRGTSFVLSRSSVDGTELGVSIPSEQVGVLATACTAGYFLGPIPDMPGAAILLESLGISNGQEVYVVPVGVSRRPVLVLVASRLRNSFASTRWIDRLATTAGEALERVVRNRKLGHR